MNVQCVLDAQMVHTFERHLVGHQLSRHERPALVAMGGQTREDPFATPGSNQHVGVVTRPLPRLRVMSVCESRAFEHHWYCASVLEGTEHVHQLADPDRVGKHANNGVGSHFSN